MEACDRLRMLIFYTSPDVHSGLQYDRKSKYSMGARLANKPNQIIRLHISARQQLEHLPSSTRTNSKHGNQRRQTFLQITRKHHSSRVRKNNGDALKLMMASSIARKHVAWDCNSNKSNRTIEQDTQGWGNRGQKPGPQTISLNQCSFKY